MNDSATKSLRGAGWLLLIGGVIGVVGIVLYALLFDDQTPLYIKLIVAAVYGGLGLLLLSVLRQRLIERKTDKYKDVRL